MTMKATNFSARFEVLAVMLRMIQIVCDVTWC